MMTVELITALFYEVDEQLRTIPKHPEVHLWPSEVVTLGLLHALKGVGNRPFYHTFRTLFRTSEAILEEPPVEGGSGLYTDAFMPSNPLLLHCFPLNHNFLRPARPISAPPG